MEIKKVIDADDMLVLETFEEKDTEKVKKKYEEDGRWEDVTIDINGDIICWIE